MKALESLCHLPSMTAPLALCWVFREQAQFDPGRQHEVAAGLVGLSGFLVLVVPELGLPELDLVFVWVEDPRKLPVLVRFGSLDDFPPRRAQLLHQRAEIIDAVVDHEGRVAGAEPLAVFVRDMPGGDASILGLVVWPAEDRAA